MTTVMYQVTDLTCSFDYSVGLQPTGINQLVAPITLYFFTCNPRTSSPQLRVRTFVIKTLDALGSLKHVSLNFNHF